MPVIRSKTGARAHCAPPRRATPCKRAIAAALLGACCVPGAALAAEPAAQHAAARQSFRIAAGPLAPALRELAGRAGVLLSFTPQQAEGRSTGGIEGEYSVEQAFAALLVGTGLEAVHSPGGGYSLRPVSTDALLLGPVRVVSVGVEASTEGTGSYGSEVVTIGKGARRLKDIPQSVSVITQQRMQDQNITDVAQALATAPGVTSVPSFLGTQFYSRGFLLNSFQYDGVPLERQSYARGSSFTGQTAIFDRLEILRGPQGLLGGGGDPSGAVNLVRKRPTISPRLGISATAGSWDRYGLQIDGSAPVALEDALRARLVVDADKRDSFVDYVESKSQTLYVAIDYQLDADTLVGFGYSHERLDARPDYNGLPNHADGSMPRFGRSTFFGAAWNAADKTQDTYYFDVSHRFNDNWTLKTTVVNARERNDQKYLLRQGRLAPGAAIRGDAYIFDYFSEHWGGDIYLNGSLSLFGRTLDVTVGANYSELDGKHIWGARYVHVPVIDVFDYRPDHNEPADDAVYASRWDDGFDSRQQGFYLSGNYALTDALTLVLGARVSDFRTRYVSDGPWGASETVSEKKGELTPYAGVVYDLDARWSLYASYTEIFKPQSQRMADGSVIEPRIGDSIEAGVKGSLRDGRLQTSLALYRMEQDNIPLADAGVPSSIATANCGGTCYQNSGVVVSRGLEAEVSGEIAAGLQLYAAYTLNLMDYRDPLPSVTANTTANAEIPKHLLRSWLDYQLPGALARLSVGGGVDVQSGAAGFGYYGREQGGYAVWNARVGYRLDDRFTLALNINNLADKRYYSSINYDHNFYGDPRHYVLTLRGTY